MVTLVEATG